MKHTKKHRGRTPWAAYLILAALAALFFALGLAVGSLSNPQPCVYIEPHAVDDAPPTSMPVVQLVAQVDKPEPTYTAEELELLALVIYQEAGGDACSDDTRLKVGTVVMNRVESDRYPDTLREVVLQRAQYGRLYWTGAVWPERAHKATEAHAVARAYDCAERVLEGERVLPADVVYQAEFTQGSEVVAHQDGFYFCK